MSRIAILGQSLWPDDAVGHDMLETARVLSGRGHEVHLFACHFDRNDPRLHDARLTRRFLRNDRSALLIYHHSIGWPEAVEWVMQAKCRRVVRYHNVTPARFFARYSEAVAQDCREGRRQVRQLARAGCDLYLSASAFNQGELLRAGADPDRCRVVPPFHRVDRLDTIDADPEMLADLSGPGTVVLFVGRFVPNKNHAAVIDAFAQYQRCCAPASRLLLVGKEDVRLKGYTESLRERAKRHGLRGLVTFATDTDDAALKACYLRAGVFLSASRHEGFCLPLVEAMALAVPVVARAAAAVPETVGGAGLLWPRPGPALLAEAIHCAAGDPAVRAVLTARGQRRYRRLFSRARIEARLVKALEGAGRAGQGPAEPRPLFAC
jgi:glycosyltransferase involved in cell wall biosynthesis